MKLLKPTILILGTLLGLLVLAELVVRLALPVPMEPGATLTLKNDIEGVKQSVSFRFDGDNLRMIGWSEDRESENLRVLCIGGNGTISLLQSSEDAWWGILAPELGKQVEKQVEVAALGHLPAGKIIPALAAAEKILKTYHVDLIICSLGFGDALGSPGDYRYDREGLAKLRSKSERRSLKYKLASAFHLLRIVRNSRTSRGHRARQAQLGAANYYRDLLRNANAYYMGLPMAPAIPRTGEDPLQEYLAGVAGFIELSKKSGTKLLMVGEPTIYKSELAAAELTRLTVPFRPFAADRTKALRVEPAVVERELQRFYKAAEAKCGAEGVGWVNLQGEIPRFADYFVTETYLTDKGSSTVANKLLRPAAEILIGSE